MAIAITHSTLFKPLKTNLPIPSPNSTVIPGARNFSQASIKLMAPKKPIHINTAGIATRYFTVTVLSLSIIRKMIYTTNAVEALHRQFRKVTKTKGSFPSEIAVKKILYLAIMGLKVRHKRNWCVILGQLKNHFGDRIN